MDRCDQSAGNFKVSVDFVERDGSTRAKEYDANIPIGSHGTVWREPSGAILERADKPPALYAGDNREWEPVEPVPTVSRAKPFVGELCIHELAWLQAPPGQEYSRHYHFTVEEAGARSTEQPRRGES